MITYYSENFEAYALGSPLTDIPPDYFYYATFAGPTETVEAAPWGGKAARILDPTNGWAAAGYNGASFGDSYTEARMNITPGLFFARGDMAARGSGAAVDGGPFSNCYLVVYAPALMPNFYLVKITAGAGSVISTTNVVGDPLDFKLGIFAVGSTIEAYFNRVLQLSAVDTGHVSGKIGFQTSGATLYFDEVLVSDSVPPVGPETALIDMRRRR